MNEQSEPRRRSLWAPTGASPESASSAEAAPATGPTPVAGQEPPVVAPTQPVSPYAAPVEPFVTPAPPVEPFAAPASPYAPSPEAAPHHEALPTAAMPTLSDRSAAIPGFQESSPEGGAPAWHSALDTGAIKALLGADTEDTPVRPERPASQQQAGAHDPTDDDYDLTRVSPRRREPWELVSSDGVAYRLSSAVSVVGRIGGAPVGDGSARIDVADSTRTMSKTHARLVWIDGVWMVEDLGSTNGTLLVDSHGRETVVPPGAPTPLVGRVLFGDFEMSLRRVGE